MIGAIEVGPCHRPVAGIHYCLARAHWNRGLVTEAAAAVLTWTFNEFPHLQRIRTAAVRENTGSRHVMEKCGLTFERLCTERWDKNPDEPVTQAVYSIARADWLEKSASQSPR